MNRPNHTAKGVQDVSGWGLAGLTAGIVVGFAIAYYGIIRLLPTDKTTGTLTLLTTIVVAAMTIGGAIGYLVTRRKI